MAMTARATTKRTANRRAGEPTLTATDWAEAGLQFIAEHGLGALTVEALARRLGVTKGSFYWHFKGRQDLLSAALHRWESRATGDAMKALDAIPDARKRLELMLRAASEPPRSRSLYAVLDRVASSRIGYLETCYRELGFTVSAARSRALFAYAAYRGLLQLAHEAPGTLPQDWTEYPLVVKAALLPQ
jgi:AcrR family transcriptional regulator